MLLIERMHPFFVHSLSYNELGSNGAAALAPGLAANGGLTSISLLGNKFDKEAAQMLLQIKAEKPNLHTLCGLKHNETQLDYSNKGFGAADAMLLAPEIAVMGSLTLVWTPGHKFSLTPFQPHPC